MSPARRMGLWALAVCAAVCLRAVFVQPPGPPTAAASATATVTTKIQGAVPACAAYVELRGAEGSVVRCRSDAPFAAIHRLAAGDAVAWGSAPQRLPGAMSDAMRLALGLPLDINRARATALARLPGISPRVAQGIVAHRERLGPFATVDDLLRVRGVGAGTLRRSHGLVCVRPNALASPLPPLL